MRGLNQVVIGHLLSHQLAENIWLSQTQDCQQRDGQWARKAVFGELCEIDSKD